jgi:uncharacterized protein (TIGR03086 family)
MRAMTTTTDDHPPTSDPHASGDTGGEATRISPTVMAALAAAPLAPDDPRHRFARAVALGAAVIERVCPEQLDGPTPCTDFDVRTLLGHLVAVLDRVARLGRGEDPFGFAARAVPDDGWHAAWSEAAHGVQAAWADDAVLERTISLPWQEGPGAQILTGYLSELTVHTWDLATATGQHVVWDDDVVAAALEMRFGLPAEGREAIFAAVSAQMGLPEVAIPFADAVPVAADAPLIDQLVAWNGRRP